MLLMDSNSDDAGSGSYKARQKRKMKKWRYWDWLNKGTVTSKNEEKGVGMSLEKQTNKKTITAQTEQQATGISKHTNLSTELWDEKSKHYRIINITTVSS